LPSDWVKNDKNILENFTAVPVKHSYFKKTPKQNSTSLVLTSTNKVPENVKSQ
jgi:hypothetical protein